MATTAHKTKNFRRSARAGISNPLFGAIVCGWIGSCILSNFHVFGADDPPALQPFAAQPSQQREDALPGYIELSDGTIHPGRIYLTRDKHLQIYDESIQRQRETPLESVEQIECSVKREWLEKEWKFKETTNDEKMFTGRTYPSREYLHTITLQDGRKISGPLSCVIYLKPQKSLSTPKSDIVKQEEEDVQTKPERFFLNKRNKGEPGDSLDSLVYVKRIRFGKNALEEGLTQAAKSRAGQKKPQKPAAN
jgi:hypothetical protein